MKAGPPHREADHMAKKKKADTSFNFGAKGTGVEWEPRHAEPSAAADPARHFASWSLAAYSGGPGC
jgi:hypothetical protein